MGDWYEFTEVGIEFREAVTIIDFSAFTGQLTVLRQNGETHKIDLFRYFS